MIKYGKKNTNSVSENQIRYYKCSDIQKTQDLRVKVNLFVGIKVFGTFINLT